MSFTLALAILGAGLTTGVQNYLRTVARQERNLRDAIALESGASMALGRLAAGSDASRRAEFVVGARTMAVEITPTASKWDLLADTDEDLAAALEQTGLPPLPTGGAPPDGLAELSTVLALTAGEEDCLRRGFTYGRGGQARSSASPPDRLSTTAGDQVDLRIHDPNVPDRLLWIRARITGGATGWAVHDYRLLRGEMRCGIED